MVLAQKAKDQKQEEVMEHANNMSKEQNYKILKGVTWKDGKPATGNDMLKWDAWNTLEMQRMSDEQKAKKKPKVPKLKKKLPQSKRKTWTEKRGVKSGYPKKGKSIIKKTKIKKK